MHVDVSSITYLGTLLHDTGQSHLNFGTGSICCVITSQLLKTCRINAFYKPLEKLDAIALLHDQTGLDVPLR